YYTQSVEDSIKQAGADVFGKRGVDYSAGFRVYDISKPDQPRQIGQFSIEGLGCHRMWYEGGRYAYVSALLDGYSDHIFMIVDVCVDQVKYVWSGDVRDKTKPVTVATFPTPTELDYCNLGGHFGPHNLHENRPGAFQSSELMFATYQNAGVRIFNTSDPMHI